MTRHPAPPAAAQRRPSTRLLLALSADPSTTSKVAARLLALALAAGARRVRARYEWHPAVLRARYRLNVVRHPLHVRLGLPADAVSCPCDLRSRPSLRGVA